MRRKSGNWNDRGKNPPKLRKNRNFGFFSVFVDGPFSSVTERATPKEKKGKGWRKRKDEWANALN